MIHDDDWTFTSINIKIGSPTFYNHLFTKATTFTPVFRLFLVMNLPTYSMGPVTLKPSLLVDRHHGLRHVVFISPQMCGSKSAREPTMRSVVMATKHGRQNAVTPGRLLLGDVQIH